MKLLIIGGSGMLGHQLWRHFYQEHDTWVTLRKNAADFLENGLFTDGRIVERFDVSHFDRVRQFIEFLQPDVVLNCVGVIKQLKESQCSIPSITLNALFPHRLAEACAAVGARLVLFSTDCVFSGKKGNYSESDIADANDLYGRTKSLGEVADLEHVVTLRSSIIGREVRTAHSLLDWFLSQQGQTVRGFRRAIYSGFTTNEMARIVERVMISNPAMHGVWQVASAPISKYDLLELIREKFELQIEVQPYDDFRCDRSLNGERFNAATGYVPPTWESMIEELAARERDKIL